MNAYKIIGAFCISLSLMISTATYADSIWAPVTDTVNSGIINAQIAGKDAYSQVDATVENGIAIFTGHVKSKEQARQLIRIAHSVTGIRAVNISGLRIGK